MTKTAQPGESQRRDEKKAQSREKRRRKRERGKLEGPRSQDTVYITKKKLPVPFSRLSSGEPVLPIIAAPRRPRDSPSSSHATRTSSDRPGPGPVLDAPAAAATHRSSVTAASHTRASLSAFPFPLSLSLFLFPVGLSFAFDPTCAEVCLVLSSSARFSYSQTWFSLFFWTKRACSASVRLLLLLLLLLLLF